MNDWFVSETTGCLHRWGDPVYYDPKTDSGFQMYRGERVSAMSFGAFGENRDSAYAAYGNWLRKARAAYAALA